MYITISLNIVLLGHTGVAGDTLTFGFDGMGSTPIIRGSLLIFILIKSLLFYWCVFCYYLKIFLNNGTKILLVLPESL